MKIAVQCSADQPEEELRSLGRWLEADPGVRRHVQVVPGSSQPTVPGQQAGDGGVLDLISLLVDGTALLVSSASLAVAVAAWRDSRPAPPVAITLQVDQREAEIPGQASREEAEATVRRLLEG